MLALAQVVLAIIVLIVARSIGLGVLPQGFAVFALLICLPFVCVLPFVTAMMALNNNDRSLIRYSFTMLLSVLVIPIQMFSFAVLMTETVLYLTDSVTLTNYFLTIAVLLMLAFLCFAFGGFLSFTPFAAAPTWLFSAFLAYSHYAQSEGAMRPLFLTDFGGVTISLTVLAIVTAQILYVHVHPHICSVLHILRQQRPDQSTI